MGALAPPLAHNSNDLSPKPKMCSVCLEEDLQSKVFCQVCKEILCGSCHNKFPDKCPVCTHPRGNNTLAQCSVNDQLCQWFEARGLTLALRTMTRQEPAAFFEQVNQRALDALQELDAKENQIDTIIKALDRRLGLSFLVAVRYDGEIEDFGVCSKLNLVDQALFAIKSPLPGQSYLVIWVKQ